MIPTFLKTDDGDFNYGAIIPSLILPALVCINVWILYGALKRRRIPFGAGYHGSPIIWIERDKNPAGYWTVFSLFSLMMAFCTFVIWAMCSGFFRKPV
jgi:hypothetical protein